MAVSAWTFFNTFPQKISGTIDLSADTIKAVLLTSTYTPDVTDAVLTDLSNEVANGNGYTTGGADISRTWTLSTATAKLDAGTDPAWTASGGNFTFRYVVLYSDTAASDDLICYCDLGADVTVLDGNTFTLTMHANGIFTLAAA